ncbi:MAG: biopolymer transporter ExbD [Methylovulum sp.]|nr:biopolymer transporter ExbD [Methylovulum sp.]
MAFGGFDQNKNPHPVAEINMVPLIDVMLVLLIIFMIAAPLMTHTVKIDLPKTGGAPQPEQPEAVSLSINADQQLFWNDKHLSRIEFRQHLQEIVTQTPQPEVHIRADQAVPYRLIAETLSDAAQAGVTRIGFVAVSESGKQ